MKWKAICDRCGLERWASELRKEWTGYMVCADTCWEPRHPQEHVRGVADKQSPPWVRPEPADVFLDTSLMLYEDGSLMLLEVSDPLSLEPDAMAYEVD
jgi:hypothetical protein